MRYIDKDGNVIEVIPTVGQIRAWFYLGSENRKPLTLLRYKDRAAAERALAEYAYEHGFKAITEDGGK